MAVDEALLDAAADRDVATLRFYQWSEPTLSLGYFQCHSDRERHTASLNCPLVRRSSGGGAIVHNREVTYSLALPAEHPLAINSERLYRSVHDELIKIIAARLGDDAKSSVFLCDSSSKLPIEPFLCFARRTSGDVLIRRLETTQPPWKIAGSAQRRRRGAVLQHGSVLLEMSRSAPELLGITDVAGISIAPEQLIAVLMKQLDLALNLRLKSCSLSCQEQASAERIEAEKFASPAWTKRR